MYSYSLRPVNRLAQWCSSQSQYLADPTKLVMNEHIFVV